MRKAVILLLVVGLASACSPADSVPGSTEPTAATSAPPTTAPIATGATSTTTPTTTTQPLPPGVTDPPEWLGTRVLPLRPDGFGEIQPTPPEMVDRRFTSPDHLPPPADDVFRFTKGPVPAEVVARSTWREECPVTLDELSYLTVTFWGFDQRSHTGELLVNAAVADELALVFEALYEQRFPIEEMRIVRMDELDAPPTGDTNLTSVFECREATGGTSWSQHAFGLAVDVNPFHNPYLRGEVVLPELAGAYTDREDIRPGMIVAGDGVVEAFAGIGWTWGGDWKTLKDWMHFSLSGS